MYKHTDREEEGGGGGERGGGEGVPFLPVLNPHVHQKANPTIVCQVKVHEGDRQDFIISRTVKPKRLRFRINGSMQQCCNRSSQEKHGQTSRLTSPVEWLAAAHREQQAACVVTRAVIKARGVKRAREACSCPTSAKPPRWPSGLGIRLKSGRPAFDSRFLRESETLKWLLQWLPCQAPGVIGSALGLVAPVSVYRDWSRQLALERLSQCGSTCKC